MPHIFTERKNCPWVPNSPTIPTEGVHCSQGVTLVIFPNLTPYKAYPTRSKRTQRNKQNIKQNQIPMEDPKVRPLKRKKGNTNHKRLLTPNSEFPSNAGESPHKISTATATNRKATKRTINNRSIPT